VWLKSNYDHRDKGCQKCLTGLLVNTFCELVSTLQKVLKCSTVLPSPLLERELKLAHINITEIKIEYSRSWKRWNWKIVGLRVAWRGYGEYDPCWRISTQSSAEVIIDLPGTLICVVCLDRWIMYARALVVILVALSAEIPTESKITASAVQLHCYRTLNECQTACKLWCRQNVVPLLSSREYYCHYHTIRPRCTTCFCKWWQRRSVTVETVLLLCRVLGYHCYEVMWYLVKFTTI